MQTCGNGATMGCEKLTFSRSVANVKSGTCEIALRLNAIRAKLIGTHCGVEENMRSSESLMEELLIAEDSLKGIFEILSEIEDMIG